MDFSLRDTSHMIRSGLDMPQSIFSQHALSMGSLEKLLPLVKTSELPVFILCFRDFSDSQRCSSKNASQLSRPKWLTQTGQFQPNHPTRTTRSQPLVFTGRKIGQGSRIQKHGRFRMNGPMEVKTALD